MSAKSTVGHLRRLSENETFAIGFPSRFSLSLVEQFMKRIAPSNQGSMKSIPLNNLFSCCNHDVSTISYEAVTRTQELIILTLRLFSYHFKSPALLGCVTLLLKKLQIMTILTCLHAFQSHNRVERFRTYICVSFRSPTCIRH